MRKSSRLYRRGKLDEAVLDKAVERILRIVNMAVEKRDESAIFDSEKNIMKKPGRLPANLWFFSRIPESCP